MKKRRVFLATTLLVSVITFTGCGTPLYEMTPEEEELIKKYAAYALGKYNTYQKDGMNGAMYVEESDDSEAESPEKEDGEEEIKENDEKIEDYVSVEVLDQDRPCGAGGRRDQGRQREFLRL